MAKLPNWIEVKKIKVVGKKPDWYVNAEIEVKYIPIKLIIKAIIKALSWRIWLYPKAIIRWIEIMALSEGTN